MVKELLTSVNTSFYTYTPKEKKNHSYLLKGLTQSFSESEILEELEKVSGEELKFTKVSKFNTRRAEKENRALPMYLVQIDPSSNLSKLQEIKYVFYHVVRWEKLVKKQEAQCRRCQRFGHAASNCNMNYRCVKCNEVHKPGECKLKAKSEIETGKKP